MIKDLTKAQQSDLERIIGARFNKFKINEILFDDSCGCYECCKLEIEIEAILSTDETTEWQQRSELEGEIERWATNNLVYAGCDCCDDELSVYLRLIPKDTK
jgi:hypothetical protein